MHLDCPQCHETLQYQGQPPRFCQHCGQRIQLPAQSEAPSVDRTVAPTTVPVPGREVPTGVGDSVGPYLTTQWLGAGGMGSVWQAVERETGRRVALKRLAGGVAGDPSSLKRFRQEAQLAAKISHPNVTFIYSTGDHAGLPYIAMELMPGTTLEDIVLGQGVLQVNQAVDHVLDVIEGLQAVHQKGMIHRDIKPSNCFVGADGRVKIGDFGLSKPIGQHDANLTKTGTFMGTPSYASPEQIRGDDVDGRTDLYSVGATLFFLLAGRTPFAGDATSMMAQIIGDPAPSLRDFNSHVPPDLDQIVRKCLAKSRSDRFASLEELKVALLPYASQFNSVADAGRRLAAYMIDQSLLQIIGFAVAFATMLVLILNKGGPLDDDSNGRFQLITTTIMLVLSLLYYSISEGIFGRGLGKWLMGLRLVDAEGQRAGFGRGLLRAFLVPAGLGLSVAFQYWSYYQGSLGTVTNPAEMILRLMVNLAVAFAPVLLCLTTMRGRNRLLGLHGLISGTRVVRAAMRSTQTLIPVVKLNTTEAADNSFGPYRTDRLLRDWANTQIYLGRDDQLSREVWIVVRPETTAPSPERMTLSRPSRQRWLDGGALEDGSARRWDAYEAVHGIPVQQFICTIRHDQCCGYARVMRQLADELIAAVRDGTLPRRINLSQVWLDVDGRLKLLDRQLFRSVQSSELNTELCPISGEVQANDLQPPVQAVQLLQELSDVIQRGRVLPHSLADFIQRLLQAPPTTETLSWATAELKKLEKRTTHLTWDIRMGILAVTLGVEALVYNLVGAIMMLVCFYLAPVPTTVRFGIGVGVALILPVAMAAYFHGGFVFHAMGIRVCRLDGHPASRLRNMMRAGLSWLPVFSMLGAFLLLMIFSDAAQHYAENEPGSMDYDVTHNRQLAFSAVVTLLLSGASIAVGILFAIFSPRRGLIDFLLRTRLMPE